MRKISVIITDGEYKYCVIQEETDCYYLSKVFLVVFGRGRAAILPTNNTQATRSIGIDGLTCSNSPNILVAIMAPILANNKCIPIADDLYNHISYESLLR